jgi:hypothetical protein
VLLLELTALLNSGDPKILASLLTTSAVLENASSSSLSKLVLHAIPLTNATLLLFATNQPTLAELVILISLAMSVLIVQTMQHTPRFAIVELTENQPPVSRLKHLWLKELLASQQLFLHWQLAL